MINILICALIGSFLWRVRGGLRIFGKKVPLNKIWFAVFFACVGCIYFRWNIEEFIIGFIACYASYQLYGWGLYLGRMLYGGELDPEKDRECELIDDILYSVKITRKGKVYYLYQYPRVFGFLGMMLTGLIMTFLWGLFFQKISLMLCGLLMPLCYEICLPFQKVPYDKTPWNLGEWVAGFYFGACLGLLIKGIVL